MGALVAIIVGVVFLLAGVASLADYGRFGTKLVNGIPRRFRFGTVDTNRRVLGIGYATFGSLTLFIGLAALLAYLA